MGRMPLPPQGKRSRAIREEPELSTARVACDYRKRPPHRRARLDRRWTPASPARARARAPARAGPAWFPRRSPRSAAADPPRRASSRAPARVQAHEAIAGVAGGRRGTRRTCSLAPERDRRGTTREPTAAPAKRSQPRRDPAPPGDRAARLHHRQRHAGPRSKARCRSESRSVSSTTRQLARFDPGAVQRQRSMVASRASPWTSRGVVLDCRSVTARLHPETGRTTASPSAIRTIVGRDRSAFRGRAGPLAKAGSERGSSVSALARDHAPRPGTLPCTSDQGWP